MKDKITIQYKDKPIPMRLIHGGGNPVGYKITCPVCNKWSVMDFGIHNISSDLTIMPSLVCPHGCGWHVWVTNGIAVDC